MKEKEQAVKKETTGKGAFWEAVETTADLLQAREAGPIAKRIQATHMLYDIFECYLNDLCFYVYDTQNTTPFNELNEVQQHGLIMAALIAFGNVSIVQEVEQQKTNFDERLNLTNELYDEFKTATTEQKQKIIQEVEKTHKPIADALKRISEKEKQDEPASEPVRSETDPDEKLCLMSAMECFDQWAEQPDATETKSRKFFEESTGVKKETPLAKLFSIYYAGFSAGGEMMANLKELEAEERKDGTGK